MGLREFKNLDASTKFVVPTFFFLAICSELYRISIDMDYYAQ